MTISALISQLTEIMHQRGDLKVLVANRNDPYYAEAEAAKECTASQMQYYPDYKRKKKESDPREDPKYYKDEEQVVIIQI